MSDMDVVITETGEGFVDQHGNTYGLISMKDVAKFHTIIQALNEALVIIAMDLEHLWKFDVIHSGTRRDRLEIASTALALVPEQDRKGGTWRLEE